MVLQTQDKQFKFILIVGMQMSISVMLLQVMVLSNGMFLGVGTGPDLQGYMWMRENLPIKFVTNDNERMRLQASGELSIGVDSTAAKLVVRGTGSTSATTALLIEDSSGTDLFEVKDDGTISGSSILRFIRRRW